MSTPGVSGQGGVCPEGCLPGGIYPGGFICLGVSAQADVADTPPGQEADTPLMNRQTPVKTQPSQTSFTAGKNMTDIKE